MSSIGTQFRERVDQIPSGKLAPSDKVIHDILHLAIPLRRELSRDPIDNRLLSAFARKTLTTATNYMAAELMESAEGTISDQTAILMAVEVIRKPSPDAMLLAAVESVSPICWFSSQIARAAHGALSVAQGHNPSSP